MIQRLKALWASLPHQLQAALLTFGAASGATLIHATEDAGVTRCSTWGCVGTVLKLALSPHMIFTAVFAGAAALKLFYMLPNGSGKPTVLLAPPNVSNGPIPAELPKFPGIDVPLKPPDVPKV